MKRSELADFSAENGQVATAKKLNLTQGALSKAIRTGRKVFVIEHEDGSLSAEEVKPFPSQPSAKRAEA
jgi:hypothetical protein